MRLLFRTVLILAIVGGIGAAAYRPVSQIIKQRNKPDYRTAEASHGTIRLTVNATGTIKPKRSVQIGTFVSGPIVALNSDFNEFVKVGDVMAEIDPETYTAIVERDQASWESRKAEQRRVQALLDQAGKDEERALMLFEEDEDFISDAELDRLRFGRLSLEAQLDLARAAVKQAKSNLDLSQANLNYTKIKAPEDGIVIDRKIDPGQTLAAQFQTPELFVLGVDLEEEMHIYASVDEADIGLIRDAQSNEQPVHFRVDAYRDELFTGSIKEIRMSSTETQNVVTYPVVVKAANPGLKLLPGMTANLTFQIEERTDVLRIPWSALRFFPKPELVRDDDRKLLEGRDDDEDEQTVLEGVSAGELVEAAQKRLRRHVWVLDGEKLRAIEVLLGISDYRYAEVVEGDIQEGTELITGIRPKKRG